MTLLEMAIYASIAACVLVFLTLLITLSANNRLMTIQRQQAEEFMWLRHAITELRQPPLGTSDDDQVRGLPRIGAPGRVLQVGDRVEIIDGLHRGEYGTIVPPPDWLPEGVVSVELSGRQGPRHMEISKLVRMDDTSRE